MRSAEDLAYALRYAGSYSGCTIKLYADIDMNGASQNFTRLSRWTNVIFDGNNHTIYNYRAQTTGEYVGFNSYSTGGSVKDLTVKNMYLRGKGYVGMYPNPISLTATNVRFEECMVYCDPGGKYDGIASMMCGYIDNRFSGVSRFTNVGSYKCVSIGDNHIGGTFGMYDGARFYDCYADQDMIISQGGHSGCLAACSNCYNEFYRCWSNSTIYGNSLVGGFTSGADGGGVYYQDCWSSGVVEGNGTVGGFVGAAVGGNTSSTYSRFINCYSTCMVGMNYSGSYLGGFAGTTTFGNFTNCYAAGEVGSIDTDPSSDTGTIGGFAGNANTNTRFSNCFYDIQTTAMRGRGVGTLAQFNVRRDDTGHLYTDPHNGLAGLGTVKMTGNSSLFPTGYEYQEGLYPQNAAMASHASPSFRAASAASATTVFCDDWSHEGGVAGYDTVRDIVGHFALSSSDPFTSNPMFDIAYVSDDRIAKICWTPGNNVSPIDRENPVISLSQSPYVAQSFAPGVEWVQAELEYKDGDATISAARHLRLIPTSFIKAGNDRVVETSSDPDEPTQLYDHAADAAFAYLDASTLQTYIQSAIAHPESVISFSDLADSVYVPHSIAGTADLSATNKIVTSLSVRATFDRTDGSQILVNRFEDKIQGMNTFDTEDCGLYKIRYTATLPDGRFLADSKVFAVTGKWSVIYHYNYAGLLSGDKISPASIFHVQSNLKSFDEFVFEEYAAHPMRDGYRFSYWSLDDAGDLPVSQIWFDAYTARHGELNRDIDVYAQWARASDQVTATIDPTIGSYESKDVGETVSEVGYPGTKILIPNAEPPYKYTFSEWDVEGGGTAGTLTWNEELGFWVFEFGSENARIEAQYDKITFKVTWIDDHTGEIVEEQVVELDDPASPPVPPTHSGYAFIGYDTAAWQKVVEDISVRILYDWDTITIPETGGNGGHEIILSVIVSMCIMGCFGVAVILAFASRRAS